MKSAGRTGHGAGSWEAEISRLRQNAAADVAVTWVEFPPPTTAATTKNLGILREFTVDEANDLQEYWAVHIELDDLSRPAWRD